MARRSAVRRGRATLLAAAATYSLLLGACGGSSSGDATPATTGAAGATDTAPAPTTAAGAGSSLAGGSSSPTASAGTTGPAAEAPEVLRFQAPLLAGGALDGTTYTGKPVAFWFWAPW